MKRSKTGSQYPDDWHKIAYEAKKRVGWRCERCHHPHQAGHILTVHHLDMDPANNEWWNLAVLCQQCHLVIQAKVMLSQYWMFEHSEWFKPHVAGYYTKLLELTNYDRNYIVAHADKIINLYRDKVL